MKKLVALAAVLLLPVGAGAGQIANSRHNLSSSGNFPAKNNNTGRICVFCHVPHNARSDTNAIWNRSDTAAGNYNWGTLNTTVKGTQLASTIGDGSKRCFSCHDGTLGLGDLAARDYTIGATTETDTTGRIDNTFYIIDDQDMAGNHPVSTPYPGSGASGQYNNITAGDLTATYVAVATVKTAGIKLYLEGTSDYGIECASCHDPHGTVNSYLLRASLNDSAICQTCHAK